MGSEAVGDGCERLREAEEEVALGREEEGDEAAMVAFLARISYRS